jgi:hypothetical protein
MVPVAAAEIAACVEITAAQGGRYFWYLTRNSGRRA